MNIGDTIMLSRTDRLSATFQGAKSLWQHVIASISLLLFIIFLLGGFDGVYGQRSGVRQGTATFQRVASTVDLDERDDKLYRRPPTYLIIASKIVRPSTVYKVTVQLKVYFIPQSISIIPAEHFHMLSYCIDILGCCKST